MKMKFKVKKRKPILCLIQILKILMNINIKMITVFWEETSDDEF